MRLFHLKRGHAPTEVKPSPVDVLVRDLEALVDIDTRAAAWAYDIATEGRPAVERHLRELAAEFGTGYTSPMCTAFAKYERAVHGIDLTAAPPDFLHHRISGAAFSEILERAEQRVGAAMARAVERQQDRQLAALRSGAMIPPSYGAGPPPFAAPMPAFTRTTATETFKPMAAPAAGSPNNHPTRPHERRTDDHD